MSWEDGEGKAIREAVVERLGFSTPQGGLVKAVANEVSMALYGQTQSEKVAAVRNVPDDTFKALVGNVDYALDLRMNPENAPTDGRFNETTQQIRKDFHTAAKDAAKRVRE
jgi:hypothetical protein